MSDIQHGPLEDRHRELGAAFAEFSGWLIPPLEALALPSGVTRNVLINVQQGKRELLYERLFDSAEVLQVPAGRLHGAKP